MINLNEREITTALTRLRLRQQQRAPIGSWPLSATTEEVTTGIRGWNMLDAMEIERLCETLLGA